MLYRKLIGLIEIKLVGDLFFIINQNIKRAKYNI